MSDENKNEIIDIKTREKLVSIPTEPDTKPSQFLNTWRKFCKDNKVKTVAILTVDKDCVVTWGFIADDDHHKALVALTLEDLREELKSDLFGEYDLGEE